MGQTKYLLIPLLSVIVGLLVLEWITNRKKICGTISVADSNNKMQIDTLRKFAEGKALFSNSCAACHSVFQKIVGPPLAGVTKKEPWKDFDLLCRYIRNWPTIKNNKYVDSLHKTYHIRHPLFPSLTNEKIKQIFEYVDAQAKEKPIAIP